MKGKNEIHLFCCTLWLECFFWQTTCGVKLIHLCVYLVLLFGTKAGNPVRGFCGEKKLLQECANNWAYIVSLARFCLEMFL